mgnify:CR=1 FL=1
MARRKILEQELKRAGEMSQKVVSGEGFDPRGGVGVLFAQLATAGIGRYQRNRVEKGLAEEELQSLKTFETNNPELAGLGLSREGRENVALKKALLQTEEQFTTPTPHTDQAKREVDIRNEFISRDQRQPLDPKQVETAFKNTSKLRKEFTANSGEFIKQRDAFSRIQASVEDPTAAGDLSLIFNYMKLLDPGSTVREGEFATAQNSAGVPDIIRARFNKVSSGERLAKATRDDFNDRSQRLFKKAKGIQKRRIKQFEGIARRNNLPVEDILLDFIGGIDDPQVKKDVVAAVEETGITPPPSDGSGFKILSIE